MQGRVGDFWMGENVFQRLYSPITHDDTLNLKFISFSAHFNNATQNADNYNDFGHYNFQTISSLKYNNFRLHDNKYLYMNLYECD